MKEYIKELDDLELEAIKMLERLDELDKILEQTKTRLERLEGGIKKMR